MIWPFIPRTPMVEAMQFRTDLIRAFSAHQRIRLLDIPRRSFGHQYRFDARNYERARALLRAQLPGPLQVPDWAFLRKVSAASGATAIAFDNTAPAIAPGDAVVLIHDSEQYEQLTISDATSGGITLSVPVAADYANASIVPLLECDASSAGLAATRTVQPVRDAQIEWTSYSGTDIANAGGAPTYRGSPVLLQGARLADGSVSANLTHAFQSVDNGLARPFVDSAEQDAVQTFGAAWQPTTRAEAWALRQWFYYLRGAQRAFWLPDRNKGITLAANIALSAGNISIRNIGFSSGYGSGDLFLKTTAGTVYTLQVASSVDAGATETLTLSSPAPAAITVAQVHTLCLMFRVVLSSDRIEWLHRAKVGPRVVVEVEEVPIP